MNALLARHRAAGVVFIAAMLVYVPCASAHKTSYGYLKADFAGDAVSGKLELAVRDFDFAFFDFAFGPAANGDGKPNFLNKISLGSPGAPCSLEPGPVALDLRGGEYFFLPFSGICKGLGEQVQTGYDLMTSMPNTAPCLPPDRKLVALLAFNIGVEQGQLTIVAAVLPVLFLARRTIAYTRFVMPVGSVVISVIALIWFIERASGVDFLHGGGGGNAVHCMADCLMANRYSYYRRQLGRKRTRWATGVAAILFLESMLRPVVAYGDRSESGAGLPRQPLAAAVPALELRAPEPPLPGRQFAHAIIVRTSPVQGTVAPETVGKVEVWYDAGIRDDFVALAVINAAGDRVDKRDAASALPGDFR